MLLLRYILLTLAITSSGFTGAMAADFLGSSVTNLPELGDASAVALSPLMEKRIGEEAMRQIKARDPAYVDDPELNDYLNTIGRRLVSAGGQSPADFEFFAVKDDTINAFAMPGGFVGVNTGLLIAAQSESELASVLAHEVSHVMQHHVARLFGKQSQLSAIGIAGLVVALLASKSGARGDLSQAAIMATQGGAIQAQLGYTREFEREADRIGFGVLQAAGFDVTGMVSFFERLQKATRTYENNAPAYLRSHPLTSERIADIEDRVQSSTYRQYLDSAEFHLLRAKLRAEQGVAREAVSYFKKQLESGRYSSEQAVRYGLASAYLRNREYKAAQAMLSGPGLVHPMFKVLAVRIAAASGDYASAQRLARGFLEQEPGQRPMRLELAEALQRGGQHAEALQYLQQLGRDYPKDARIFEMQARSYAATGNQVLQHRALAENYQLLGALPSAIEQLQLAQRLGSADFYVMSSIDARLRELKELMGLQQGRK